MSQTGTLMGFVHRRRRGAELFLLVLALAVGIGAYAAVGLGLEGQVPADIVGYGGWLTALIVAAHVTVRIVAPYADPVLLPLVAALKPVQQLDRTLCEIADRYGNARRDWVMQEMEYPRTAANTACAS